MHWFEHINEDWQSNVVIADMSFIVYKKRIWHRHFSEYYQDNRQLTFRVKLRFVYVLLQHQHMAFAVSGHSNVLKEIIHIQYVL